MIYCISICIFTSFAISLVSPRITRSKNTCNRTSKREKWDALSEALPAKKGNISTVMQSLGKTSFGHPKIRKEEFKLEQVQRTIA